MLVLGRREQETINIYTSDGELCEFWINEYKKEDTAFNASRLKMACD